MKTVVTAALSVAVPVVLFLAALYLGQDRLLYFPARAPLEAWAVAGLRPWPSEDDPRGLLREPDGAARGTAVVFHGNAGHAGHRGYYADALASLGWRVVLAEYPGYGPRAGPPGPARPRWWTTPPRRSRSHGAGTAPPCSWSASRSARRWPPEPPRGPRSTSPACC